MITPIFALFRAGYFDAFHLKGIFSTDLLAIEALKVQLERDELKYDGNVWRWVDDNTKKYVVIDPRNDMPVGYRLVEFTIDQHTFDYDKLPY